MTILTLSHAQHLAVFGLTERKCASGLECLRAYHYEYDEKNKLLKSQAEHDWSSHAALPFICLYGRHGVERSATDKCKFKTYTPKAFSQKKIIIKINVV